MYSIQGSQDNKSFIKSFWLDYSLDNCKFETHSMGEIKCFNQYKSVDDVKMYDDLEESIQIWPLIKARFIRIRPSDYEGKIGLRFELYGYESKYERMKSRGKLEELRQIERARCIQYKDVPTNFRKGAELAARNQPLDTNLIQIDCKVLIEQALIKALVRNVFFVESDKDNMICIFTVDQEKAESALQQV